MKEDKVLERLHAELMKVNAEADAVMVEWRSMRSTDGDLLVRYYAAQDRSLKLLQEIIAHKNKPRP